MTKNACDLQNCFLCKHCLPDWLPAVAANRKNVTLKKGQPLFIEDEPVEGIYFIFSGVVKVHKRWGADKELILRFAAAGDVVGQLGLGDDPIYPLSATAIEPGLACFISMEFFESTISVNSNFTRELLRVLANNLQESEKKMRNLAHMPVKRRVAQALISLHDQFGATGEDFINIDLTRQNLASFTGAVYESLFRVINEMVDEKLIALSGKNIRIINRDSLTRLTEETEAV